jgi:hypothetical protein
MHPLTFIEACWTFTETKQWMWVQKASGCCVSAVATVMWETAHVACSPSQLSDNKIKRTSICSSTQIGRLRPGNHQLWPLHHDADKEFPESGQRRRQPFSCTVIMPGPIPVWWPWCMLQSLDGLSYHTHCTVQIWCLLTSISSGGWKMDFAGNIFLTTMLSWQLWESGPPLLVQIFPSAASRLPFIAVEMHSQRWSLCGMIVFSSWKLVLSNCITVHLLSIVVSVEINISYFWSIIHTCDHAEARVV